MTSAKKTPAAKRVASTNRYRQSGDSRQALQVISKRDGFRRAGREWNGSTTVLLDDLTDEQIDQLESEPMLVVLQVEMPAEAPNEPAPADTVGDQA